MIRKRSARSEPEKATTPVPFPRPLPRDTSGRRVFRRYVEDPEPDGDEPGRGDEAAGDRHDG